MKKYNIAVVGATGAVGTTVLEILAQRKFPVKELFPLASERSEGKTVMFDKKSIDIENLAKFDFSRADIAIFSAGGSVSADYAPLAASKGCIVIDNTSHFRYEADIPLVIAEVNPEDIALYRNRNIIANPNCSTMQLLVALKPIYDAVGISRINVATYQSVSGAGQGAIHELAHQTGELLNGRPIEAKKLPQQIAFNVIPHIDVFLENGYTKEEMKMLWETQKIFHDDAITVNATAVRVPVFYGHSEAVHLETKQKISVEAVRALLKKAPGVTLMDNPQKQQYPTAVKQGSGTDDVYVGRIREDLSHPLGLDLWIVADNVRKGAALNAVQIAECLLNYL
jgi:aspartate-semialdehyde dehydrogenase